MNVAHSRNNLLGLSGLYPSVARYHPTPVTGRPDLVQCRTSPYAAHLRRAPAPGEYEESEDPSRSH